MRYGPCPGEEAEETSWVVVEEGVWMNYLELKFNDGMDTTDLDHRFGWQPRLVTSLVQMGLRKLNTNKPPFYVLYCFGL